MTTPVDDPGVQADEDAQPAVASTLVELLDLSEPLAPTPSLERERAWWRIGFPIVLVVLITCVPVLMYFGARVVLQSDNGRLILSPSDPAKPGWEAAVEPTPTGSLASVSDLGQLSSVAMMSLTSDGAGSVIFIPESTRVPNLPDYQTLTDAFAAGGAPGLKAGLDSVLGIDAGSVTVVNRSNWEDLVSPVGAITVANPDNVNANGEVFPRGPLELAPDRVGAYLLAGNYAESDTNRLLRQEAFWGAWLTKVAANGSPDAVPGESETGPGRFLRALASDQVTYSVLPVKVQSRPDMYAGVFVPITDEVNALVARSVPFPTAAPPGSRPRLRVLDGTGKLDHGLAAALSLAANGAQIETIGNASTFGVTATQFIITDELQRQRAEQLRAALGVGEIVMSGDTGDSVDIMVIVGTDAIGLPSTEGTGVGAGAGQTTTTTVFASTTSTKPTTTKTTVTKKAGGVRGG